MRFSNLDALLNYCKTCAICKLDTRIDIDVGPDKTFYDAKFNKHQVPPLNLSCKGLDDNQFAHSINFKINPLTHEFQFNIDCQDSSTQEYLYKRLSNFAFYLNVECPNCESYINSQDVEIDLKNNVFTNFGIERFGYYLDANNKIVYEDVFPEILKLHKSGDTYTDGNTVTNVKTIAIPFFELDFSDIAELKHKIELLSTFS